MSKKLSLTKQIFIQKIVCGLGWIITGICMLLNSIPSKIVGCIALSIIIVAMTYIRFAKKEQEDEMAEKYMNLTKSKVLDYIMMISMVIGIISLFVDISFNFRNVFYFMVGCIELLIGIMFMKYERTGE